MPIEDLEPFVGTWDVEARFPAEWQAPPVEGEVSTTFEWLLGGAFLLMRSQAPDPVPNGHCILGANEATGGFTQHYFDNRGVARVYEMGFDGTTWTLERSTADFTPLDFMQRYVGTFDDDGRAIRGAWEICHDGQTWQNDFELDYLRRR
ncbi:MAG TPA: DUF1579 family protein [Acidimicrobiales bacterium]|nr:DUF1579 family protein [Acidimicrobiales bacterium]